MTIVYEIVPQDVIDLNIFTLRNVPAVRSQVLKKQLGVSAAGAAGFLVVSSVVSATITPLAIGSALAIGGVLYVTNRMRHPVAIREIVRKQAAAGDLNMLLGVHQVTLTPEGVRQRSPAAEGLIQWAGVQSVIATTGPVYIFLNDGKAIILPQRAFASEGQKTTFMDDASRFFDVSRKPA